MPKIKRTNFKEEFRVVHHTNSPETRQKIRGSGIKPKQKMSDKRSTALTQFEEKLIRKIFDEEKPKSIQEAHSKSSFFCPLYAPTGEPVLAEHILTNQKTHFFETLIRGHARVANMQKIYAALTVLRKKISEKEFRTTEKRLSGFFPELTKEERIQKLKEMKIRELARKYWSESITLNEFSRFYKKIAGTKIYQKTNEAPIGYPKQIESPEILYNHNLKKVKEIAISYNSETKRYILEDYRPE
ncbi:MAG: hypothetical protein JW703_05300 [Candidatus Diapherotrites archaeon]|nr:hypothetical protein [Candidatus Diapherotrites archaeon]